MTFLALLQNYKASADELLNSWIKFWFNY